MRRNFDRIENYAPSTYKVAVRTSGAILRAWPKLEECERRLGMYEWAESLNDAPAAQYRVLLEDCIAAFLMSFEAVFEFLFDELGSEARVWKTKRDMEEWLRTQQAYDIDAAGLRSLRHYEAHLERLQTGSLIKVELGAVMGGGEEPPTTIERNWRLACLTKSQLERLRFSPLRLEELELWNGIVRTNDASVVLRSGLFQLAEVVKAAEKVVGR